MATSKIQAKFFFTFFLSLSIAKVTVQGLQYGKVRITQQTDEGHYCEAVSFPYRFTGRDPVRVFVSVNHGKMSSGVHGSPLAWAESVNANGFQACMVEHGIGSAGNATIDWVAYQGTQRGVAHGKERFNRFTSGVQCRDITIPQPFLSIPKVFVSSNHGVRNRKDDAVLLWTENIARGGFKICQREARHFDGPHRNLDVEWMAYVELPTSWNAKNSGTIRFSDTGPPSQVDNFAYCKVISFTKPFYQPPSILFSPTHVFNRSDPNSLPADCNGINIWAEEITKVSFRVCMKDMSGLDSSHDPIMADYLVFGDIDPCLNLTCENFGKCKAFSRDDARCVCEENCPTYEDLVCASNGVTYDNLCLLKKNICRSQGNFTHSHPGSCSEFSLQKGRTPLQRTPTWSDAVCVLVELAPYTFYPDKKLHIQASVSFVNTSDRTRVHEATVSWVEGVSDQNFTACVTTTGRNDRPSKDIASVEWIAYQGSPEGGVSGEEKFARWWTATTCRTVNLPRGKFQSPPVVLVTAEHFRIGLKHDAAHIWTQSIQADRFDICMRELQNFDGVHEKISVNWLAFESLKRPLFSEYGLVSYRSLSQPPPLADNFAYCQSVSFARNHTKAPIVVLSADDNSTLLHRGQTGWYGVSAWIEHITRSGFRACLKDVHAGSNTIIHLTYAVLSEICNNDWKYYKGFCYKTISSCQSWNKSQSICSTYSANLPSVKNQEENVYVQQRHGGEKAWIGLNDITTEGRFIWTDGSAVNFTNWAKSQPNNLDNQDCVHTLGLSKNYKWNDVQCSECFNYTCKKDYDECLESSHYCPAKSTCINTIGSYDCHCKSGYSMVRGECIDVDECSLSHGCHSNSFCINTIGSYRCECNLGYYRSRQNKCTAVSLNTTSSGCGAIITESNGIRGQLWSQNFPSSYPHNSNCYWSLSSQVNISLNFHHFNTETTHDPLSIYDGGSTSSPLIGKYSGSSLPPPATSSSNQLYVKFTSDGSGNPCGFIASYEVTQSGSLRLAGGRYGYGRVEVYYAGEWGTVCDRSWDINDANVVCRQLGFLRAVSAYRGAYYGQGSGRIWFNNVGCSGSENQLTHCKHGGFGQHSCSHSNDASVKCQISSVIRLRNGGANYGRVEVYYSGQWGTVCDDGIGDNSNGANVICRMLGFPSARAYYRSANYGQGSGQIWLDDVQCTGSESSITQCSRRRWGSHNCQHSEDFSVKCNT